MNIFFIQDGVIWGYLLDMLGDSGDSGDSALMLTFAQNMLT
jgi:hypothetical protein